MFQSFLDMYLELGWVCELYAHQSPLKLLITSHAHFMRNLLVCILWWVRGGKVADDSQLEMGVSEPDALI